MDHVAGVRVGQGGRDLPRDGEGLIQGELLLAVEPVA